MVPETLRISVGDIIPFGDFVDAVLDHSYDEWYAAVSYRDSLHINDEELTSHLKGHVGHHGYMEDYDKDPNFDLVKAKFEAISNGDKVICSFWHGYQNCEELTFVYSALDKGFKLVNYDDQTHYW